jgi:2-polyprenyl-3-methyl-5-hydroxy-6-metoxy-1,4-benzoquinol methylase
MPESVACDLCGVAEAMPQPKKTQILRISDGLGICRCSGCGLIYLSPRPTPAELRALYASHPFWSAENIARFPERETFDRARMQRVERWKPGRGTMLGVGCLEGGYVLRTARSRGWEVLAVESVEALAAFARDRLRLPVERSEAWDLTELQGRTFDVVYGHSFEHVFSPRRTMRQCRSLLSPDGLLVMDVPNQFHSLKDQLKSAVFEVLGSRLLPHLYVEASYDFHLYYFNPATLRALLASEGFEVLELRTYLPHHPVYRGNPRAGWLQELLYAVGGLFERGPSMEVIARPRGSAA